MSAAQIVPRYDPNSYETVFDINAASARNIFTAVFICLNTAIILVGGRLIKRQAHRKLLKGEAVPLPSLTPWLSLTSALAYVWSMRRLPGGLFGLLMMISGAFSTINRFVINSYIIERPTRLSCTFSQGLVAKHNNGTLKPVPEWPAAQLAFSARDAATINKGVQGIWQTVNANTSAFAPRESDVLGRWICDEREPSLMNPTDWADSSTLEAFNKKTGYHFDESSGYAGAIINKGKGPWTSIFVYSANQFDNSTSLKLWDMKATMIRDLGSVAKNASNFHCRLNITDTTWQPTRMPAQRTLDTWNQVIVGSFAEIEPEEYGTTLATNLNMMSLIAGSGNSKNWSTREVISKSAPTTYGCLHGVTVIYKQVFAIALVLVLLVVVMGIVDLYDIARNKWDKRHKKVEAIPIELLNWQLAMVQKMIKNEGLTERQMNELEFYWDTTTGDYACRTIGKGASHTYEAVENSIVSSSASNSKSSITISTNEFLDEKL